MQMDHRRPSESFPLIASWSALASITPLNFSKPAKNPANTFSLLTHNIVHGVDQQQEDARRPVTVLSNMSFIPEPT